MTVPPTASEAKHWREVDVLLERSAKLQLYVMLCTTIDAARLIERLADHVRWVIEQERHGWVFLAGPVAPAESALALDSIIVIRAANLDQARQIADDDPLVKEGIVSFEMREWTVFEGALRFNISLSSSKALVSGPDEVPAVGG